MPTVIVPFPSASGRAAVAVLKLGKKRTVRFVPRAPRPAASAPAPAATGNQARIDAARMTAHHYRRLASMASTTRMRKTMEDHAANWERRAEEFTAAKHGPQQPGELFE